MVKEARSDVEVQDETPLYKTLEIFTDKVQPESALLGMLKSFFLLCLKIIKN
jgi:hypothetical protein